MSQEEYKALIPSDKKQVRNRLVYARTGYCGVWNFSYPITGSEHIGSERIVKVNPWLLMARVDAVPPIPVIDSTTSCRILLDDRHVGGGLPAA